MRDYVSIYTDGQDRYVTHDQARLLETLGLVQPHPGVGEDGILEGDLKLTQNATWDDVDRAVDHYNWRKTVAGSGPQ